MSIEQTKYAVVSTENEFEIRDYEPHILAESIVVGALDYAANAAFYSLFQFISGDNLPCAELEKSMPISQKDMNKRIQMTSPIWLRAGIGNWAVRFMMPASYTLENLPQPMNFRVTLCKVPAQRMATVRYSSFWAEKSYLKNKITLESWIKKVGLTTMGDPIWARYNQPFMPWFWRRNEVLIPIGLTAH